MKEENTLEEISLTEEEKKYIINDILAVKEAYDELTK